MSDSTRTRLQRSAARPVSRRGDAAEREAERAADEVVRGGSVSGWSFSSVPGSSGGVQRQEAAPKEKGEDEKKKEALKKAGEAALATPQGQALKEKVLQDPLVKSVKDAVTSTPGLIATGAVAAGGVAALAATGKELPVQPPEIPLEKLSPKLAGVSAKITYEGPVNAPTYVGLTITVKEQGPKGKSSKSDPIAADIARLRAQEEMFKRGRTYAPGSKEAEEERLLGEAVTNYVLRSSTLPGITIPLVPAKAPKKEEEQPAQPAPASPSAAPPAHADVDAAFSATGRPLDPGTRRAMETRFGHDFSRVRIHDDARAAAIAESIQAVAFTLGDDVAFAPGRYDPSSVQGKHLLAHEMTHVVQNEGAPRAAGLVRRRPKQEGAQAAPPQVSPPTDDELRAYLETIRRTRAVTGGADGPRLARAVVARFRMGAAGFTILTIPDRALLITELLGGDRTAENETAILDLFTEALPEERLSLKWEVGEERVRGGLSPANRRLFDDLVRTSVDRAVEALVTNWTVDEVVRILDRHGDAHVIDDLLARRYRVVRFETAFDTWRYDDGRREEVELRGLRGNTDRSGRIIRIRASLTSEEAASVLFHEAQHAFASPGTTQDEYLEEEIAARVATEEFRIRHGMGPTRSSYRRPDGTVDEDAIRREIRGSSHYNPAGRRRIGRRYVGEARVSGWRRPRRGGAAPLSGSGARP